MEDASKLQSSFSDPGSKSGPKNRNFGVFLDLGIREDMLTQARMALKSIYKTDGKQRRIGVNSRDSSLILVLNSMLKIT